MILTQKKTILIDEPCIEAYCKVNDQATGTFKILAFTANRKYCLGEWINEADRDSEWEKLFNEVCKFEVDEDSADVEDENEVENDIS